MSRTDGRKLVALAAAATTFALTFSTIYLPYMADRDKLRGLFEEEHTIPEGARREIRQLQRAEAAELQRQQKQSEQQQQQGDIQQQQRKGAGSMWSSFRRNQ